MESAIDLTPLSRPEAGHWYNNECLSFNIKQHKVLTPHLVVRVSGTNVETHVSFHCIIPGIQ